ncbi:MAG: methyltransferase domain-containing protein, partial [Desulfobulbaceae bacterium]|nr:methyltransferase domain-containing protein [Desulfobulbaceae bacterium]
MNWFNRFHRLEYDGVPLYIDSQMPDWFVPSSRTDALLRVLQEQTNVSAAVSLFAKEYEESPESVGRDYDLLKNLLWADPPTDYQGRFHHLQLGPLKEIWFHLTDKCNLSCRHCLFGSSPALSDAIGPVQLYSTIDQARGMGCHLFYFTGGEPFVYPDFTGVLSYVLDGDPAAHVVVLTNGLLFQEHLDQLAALDHGRLHLQVSLDGLVDSHDYLRGRGAFVRLRENLAAACDAGLAITVSVAVNVGNVDQLPDIARTAKEMGAAGLHLMYHFVRGKGTDAQFVRPEKIFERILETVEVCRELDLQIDNLEAMKSQIFSIPGTRHDLSNMGWESVAVGPDGVLYPSPALVCIPELACGSLADGLEQVWLQNEMLEKIRRTSQVDAENWQESPFRFLNGGGDPDHSWVAGKSLVGHDPYMALYDRLLLWLVTRQATHYPDQGLFRLRMGDVRHDCPESDENGHKGQVSLTHCNCVISLADHDGHSSVKEFYGFAALQANEDIVNPFGPTDESTEFIPEVSRTRSYGCGSPVKDAKPQKGETVVDLGSGSGVECFFAASDVGAEGRVFGIDMTDDMLALARSSKEDVVRELGFDNIEFRKGYLEDIPLEDNSADAVISNCVINLSPDKRQTYLEIFRILKPGGRLIVSDVVTDEQVEASIRNSVRYRGECLGGAMRQDDLVQMLIDCGFEAVMLHKRYPYRQLGDNRFFSLTYEARKPAAAHEDTFVKAVYRGPHRFLETGRGTRMDCGRITLLTAAEAARCDDSVFLLDDEGVVTNVEQEPCTCGIVPEEAGKKQENRGKKRAVPIRRHSSGCM